MRTASTALLAFALLLAAGTLACAGPAPGETAAPPAAAGVDIEAWERTLAAYGREGGVDYAALGADRADLDAYLASLGGARPEAWSEERRLAFWINAYNAVVVHHVLDRYPGIASVKQEEGFFDRLTFPVAGEERTLDAIEAEARKLDPRSHFAVVCASASCPDLLGEAYRAARLDAQLDAQTRSFLADPAKGLRFDRERGQLWLSSIFKWYGGDFTGGSTVVAFFARGGIVEWTLPFLPPELAAEIERRDPAVRYLDYDWSLNDR